MNPTDKKHSRELWQNFLDEIRKIIPSYEYDAWFSSLSFISFDDKILTLHVPSEFFATKIEER